MQLSSLWVLVFRVSGSVPVDFEGAHIEASPVLSWAANNTKKMQSQPHSGTETEAWTLISTRAFGKKHKCPQEAIPPAHAAMVTELMLSDFETSLGLPPGGIRSGVVESKAQLWGAGVPMTVMETGPGDEHGFIWDDTRKVGVCGDWLSAPSIEGAVLSGTLLAEAIVRARGGSGGGSVNLSMKPVFQPVPSSDVIGSFTAGASENRSSVRFDTPGEGGSGKGRRGREGGGSTPFEAPGTSSRRRRQGKGRVQGSWRKETTAGGEDTSGKREGPGKGRSKGAARGKGEGG